jgi:uncharacterized protein
MESFIGREKEKQILLNALKSGRPELIAVIGRRRVGKTFLIRNVYKGKIVFEFSGSHDAGMKIQLKNFRNALTEYSRNNDQLKIPGDWTDAFSLLKELICSYREKDNKVVFLDEFPWIETPRSGFIPAFEHFWNSWASMRENLIIIICGSSASWMIKNVVNNKGGLHNRLTSTIRLMPFRLKETELFFKKKGIILDRQQVATLYMIMGGIPFYLNSIHKGESASMYVDRLCFTKDGLLTGEFSNLYHSLFKEAGKHIAVVKTLAKHPEGLTRDALVNQTGVISGGRFSGTLSELEESGFINSYTPFGKTSSSRIYKLVDEFTFFYYRFLEQNLYTGINTWLKLSSDHRWKVWSGFAWERLCLKHTEEIKTALGISGVLSENGIWRTRGDKTKAGAQIDLYINRNDDCINLCETKYYSSKFTIDKNYAKSLERKIDLFRTETGTTRTLFLTFITVKGLKENQYSIALVQKSLTLDSLFL